MGHKQFLVVFSIGQERFRYKVTLRDKENLEDIVKRARQHHEKKYLEIYNNPDTEDLVDRDYIEAILYPINFSTYVEDITDIEEVL